MPIDVTRDPEGLRRALDELLEEGFIQSRLRRSMEAADEEGADRMFGSAPPRTLSPGYYRWANYLMNLVRHKEEGLVREFTMVEAEGLIVLAEARRSFERNHPPCGKCSAYQDSSFATACHACGVEFVRKAS